VIQFTAILLLHIVDTDGDSDPDPDFKAMYTILPE
jgi:hypothetical protein